MDCRIKFGNDNSARGRIALSGGSLQPHGLGGEFKFAILAKTAGN